MSTVSYNDGTTDPFLEMPPCVRAQDFCNRFDHQLKGTEVCPTIGVSQFSDLHLHSHWWAWSSVGGLRSLTNYQLFKGWWYADE